MTYLDQYRPSSYCAISGTCDVCAEDGACREYIEEIANDTEVPVEFAAFYCLDHEADREGVEDAWNELNQDEKDSWQ